MEQQASFVPQILLPDGWNHVWHDPPITESLNTLRSCCEICGWNGDPSELLKPHRLLDAITSEDISGHDCIRCQILALIFDAFRTRKTGPFRSPRIISFRDRNYIRVEHEFPSAYDDVFLFISADSHEAEVPHGIPRGRLADIDTSTDSSLSWAREQIQDHQHCCQPVSNNSFVPTRLVRVSQKNPGKDVALDDCVPGGSRYAALSYLWGKKTQPCSTTPSTLINQKECIKWSTLPKTIQDAITYTRRLGIEYLWVDCLCILQGDREDWEKESGRMSDIYKNAYVTLTAVWGSNSDSGLFSTSEQFRSIPVAVLRLKDETWPLSVRQFHEPISIHDRYLKAGDSESTPLFDRAWTYQERLISPRVLYFMRKELVFECFCHTACECGLTQHRLLDYDETECPKKVFFKVTNPAKNLTSAGTQSNDTAVQDRGCGETSTGTCDDEVALESSHYDPREAWLNVVLEYSLLKLTKLDDKLPAIGAVARQFQTVRPEEHYLAGLWSGSLHRDLLWRTSSQNIQRLTTAPTWSWASIPDTPITYPSISINQLTPSAEIVEASCRYVDDNPFGVFKSSSLKLRGRVISCWLYQGAGHTFEVVHWRSGLRIESSVFIDICADMLFSKIPRKVYLLEIAKGLGEHLADRHFLILGRKSKISQTFSRMGILHFAPDGGDHKKNEESMKIALNGFSTTETINLM